MFQVTFPPGASVGSRHKAHSSAGGHCILGNAGSPSLASASWSSNRLFTWHTLADSASRSHRTSRPLQRCRCADRRHQQLLACFGCIKATSPCHHLADNGLVERHMPITHKLALLQTARPQARIGNLSLWAAWTLLDGLAMIVPTLYTWPRDGAAYPVVSLPHPEDSIPPGGDCLRLCLRGHLHKVRCTV